MKTKIIKVAFAAAQLTLIKNITLDHLRNIFYILPFYIIAIFLYAIVDYRERIKEEYTYIK